MKRLLLRLSLLSGVVGLGAVAVVEAKRALHGDDPPREPRAMARHEEEPRPIPLTLDADAEPAADFDPYASAPAAPRGAVPAAAAVPVAGDFQNGNRPYADPRAAEQIGAEPAADVYDGRQIAGQDRYAAQSPDTYQAEPRRMDADRADARQSAADPFGSSRDRAAGGDRYAQQATGTDDEQSADPDLSAPPPAGLRSLPAEAADPQDLQDNFAPPARLREAPGNQPAPFTADADFHAPPERAAPPGEPRSDGTGRPGEKQLEGAQAPTLTIEKRAPAEIQVGKPATFAIIVRNTGQTAAQGVEVHDVIPQGTQLVSTAPPAKRGPQGELIWDLGTVRPASESTLEVQLMPVAEGEIGSVATLHFRVGASGRTTATRPQLALDVAAPQRVMIGGEAVLKIKLSNPGTGAATGVVLTETVPAGLRHVGGAELEFEVGTLKPGEHRELELALSAAEAGQVVNLLSARADANVSVETRTQMEVIAPQLKVGVTGPKRRYLERSAVYNISVTNPGTAPAREVELAAVLPKGLKFVEANNAGQYDAASGAVFWSLEELPAGETGTVTLTALATDPGELKLHVKGRAQQGLADDLDETVVVEGIAAILFELVDVSDPIEVGGQTSYEIRVINQGSKAASNVRLVALLPPQMQAIAADGPARHVIDGQRVLFDPVAQLAPKADMTYTVKVTALEAGDLRLRVQVVTDEIRTPITKEESTRVYAED